MSLRDLPSYRRLFPSFEAGHAQERDLTFRRNYQHRGGLRRIARRARRAELRREGRWPFTSRPTALSGRTGPATATRRWWQRLWLRVKAWLSGTRTSTGRAGGGSGGSTGRAA